LSKDHINISIPKGLAKAVKYIVDETSLGFLSKSEVLRCAMNKYLENHKELSRSSWGGKTGKKKEIPPVFRGYSRTYK